MRKLDWETLMNIFNIFKFCPRPWVMCLNDDLTEAGKWKWHKQEQNYCSLEYTGNLQRVLNKMTLYLETIGRCFIVAQWKKSIEGKSPWTCGLGQLEGTEDGSHPWRASPLLCRHLQLRHCLQQRHENTTRQKFQVPDTRFKWPIP